MREKMTMMKSQSQGAHFMSHQNVEMKKMNSFFQIWKKPQVQPMSFHYINVETNFFLFSFLIILHSQIWKKKNTKSSYYLNVETKKLKNWISPSKSEIFHLSTWKKTIWKNTQGPLTSFSYRGRTKKWTNQSNEFLLHVTERKVHSGKTPYPPPPHRTGHDRGENSPPDPEPNGIPFGSKSKG